MIDLHPDANPHLDDYRHGNGMCCYCDKPAVQTCTEDCDEEGPAHMCEDHMYADPISCVWRCWNCAGRMSAQDEEHAQEEGRPFEPWGPEDYPDGGSDE